MMQQACDFSFAVADYEDRGKINTKANAMDMLSETTARRCLHALFHDSNNDVDVVATISNRDHMIMVAPVARRTTTSLRNPPIRRRLMQSEM